MKGDVGNERLEGRARVVIENVRPRIDEGRFPVKRIVGDEVLVEADIFGDGHDCISAAVQYRKDGEPAWREAPMEPIGNDRWRGAFAVTEVGRYRYTVAGWINPLLSWGETVAKKAAARQPVETELLVGIPLIEAASRRAAAENPRDAERLRAWVGALDRREPAALTRLDGNGDGTYSSLLRRYADRPFATRHQPDLSLVVDPARARASAWYEVFPRSTSADPGRHGTLRDLAARFPYIASLGFDVVYLPPVHPIGRSHRKGPNNAPVVGPDNPGSPWAIGGREGGHKAIHPELGTLDDFDGLVREAERHGLTLALDLAFQCSPDHPYVRDHPEWFRHRPDGSIQHAENPPKKYEDIVPFDFECEPWRELWAELRSIVDFWIDRGIRTFRVDNPHTKPFAFWEWLIADVRGRHPDVLFLSEAFTRPKLMYHLTKLGFTHSYTYFAWRHTASELRQYFDELSAPDLRDYFRAHLWPNTPDILTEYLQTGGRPASMVRFVLAATLSANYGIYGPTFELVENRPLVPGKEEYLDSEKYQVRHWDLDRRGTLRDFVARVNRARRENPALLSDDHLRFHHVDNEQILAFSKRTTDAANVVLVVVNLDPHHAQSGRTHLDLSELHVEPGTPFQVHDLLTDARYVWQGPRNYVELRSHETPAHVFRVRTHLRSERDFDYYA